jgi:glycine amidinotransferase
MSLKKNINLLEKVCSYNEWDPLEEVIVGSVKGAMRPEFEPLMNSYYPNENDKYFLSYSYSKEEVDEAESQLNNFANILAQMGIIVQRPEPIDFSKEIRTPEFSAASGNCSACPRDVLLIIGNRIIEAPMAMRSRFFEYLPYRKIIKEYFKSGAKWYAAPKPSMSDKLYISNFSVEDKIFDADTHTALTDFEPCFDAASFMRFGKDIFYQPDLVTNDFGAEWLKSIVGSEYRFHRITFKDRHPPQHLDTTLVPLREGLVMVNPERPCSNGYMKLFEDNNWKIIDAPPSVQSVEFHSPEVSNWISMNVISIDQSTVVVEENEENMIKLMEEHDFKVITCPFDKVYKFGGGFHCCTTDIRRKGQLTSYFKTLD